MIEVWTWPTPNGHKVHITLEELDLAYKVVPINIGRGDQFKPEFLAITPNHRIPAIVDPDEVEAARRNLQQMIQEALSLLPNVPTEVRMAVLGASDPVRLAYFLGSVLTLGVEDLGARGHDSRAMAESRQQRLCE